jgi:predicted transcriptional regulator
MFRAESFDEDQEISIFNAIQLASNSHDRDLIHFLIHPHVLAILSITARRGMTVNDVSRSLQLPLATCYKLVEQMVELGLMARVGTTRTSSRGRAANYTSSLKSVSLKMVDMNIEAVVTWKNGQMESFRREFRMSAADNEALIIEHRGALTQMGQL